MPDEMERPSLPPALKNAVESQPSGQRQPMLAQGRLLCRWNDQPWTKAKEASAQADNLQRYFGGGTPARALLEAIVARQDNLVAPPASLHKARFTVARRLLIGVGLPNTLESGLTLHPLYGLPYLPGTALKGVSQGYLLQRWAAAAGIPTLSYEQRSVWSTLAPANLPMPIAAFERVLLAPPDLHNAARQDAVQKVDQALARWQSLAGTAGTAAWTAWQVSDRALEQARTYTAVFGSPGQRGRVVFLDALPEQLQHLRLQVDTVTPHQQQYYRPPQTVPPADYYDPVPVPFLAVSEGTRFALRTLATTPVDDAYARFALHVIQAALKQRGIGAKTSSGYGQGQVQILS